MANKVELSSALFIAKTNAKNAYAEWEKNPTDATKETYDNAEKAVHEASVALNEHIQSSAQVVPENAVDVKIVQQLDHHSNTGKTVVVPITSTATEVAPEVVSEVANVGAETTVGVPPATETVDASKE